jgi:predicted DsbA family dithiol-disulfide isomerase
VGVVEVFADVACPFTHVGLRRITAHRDANAPGATLRLRAWPLELVNGVGLAGPALAPKVAALRAGVAPDLFAGFDPDRFPGTTLPAMASEAAAYRVDDATGERFARLVRDALFEQGLDVADHEVLHRLREAAGVPDPTAGDEAQVRTDFEEGRARGVQGSPHFFTPGGDFFCPSLDITHPDGRLEIAFDRDGFDAFVAAAF